MDEREALNATANLSRLLLTVGAGAIVLSGTLLQTVYVGRSICLLIASWLLLGLSFLFGYRVHGRYVTQLAKLEFTVRHGRLENLSLLQFLAVAAGLICFAIFVLANVGAGPSLNIRRTTLSKSGRALVVTVDCRSGTDAGCRGEVVLHSNGKHGHAIGHGLFASETDGPSEARIPLANAASLELQRTRAPRVHVTVLVRGQFGNETEASSLLRVERSRARQRRRVARLSVGRLQQPHSRTCSAYHRATGVRSSRLWHRIRLHSRKGITWDPRAARTRTWQRGLCARLSHSSAASGGQSASP